MQVTLCARRAEQAQRVAALTGAAVTAWPPDPDSWDLLVNSTPVGTAPLADESPLPASYAFQRGTLVYDLVYNPPHTRLLADAANAGCRTIGGLDMLVAQAQAQFEWWTGQRPADRVMRDAAMRGLEQQAALHKAAALRAKSTERAEERR
jgi:shikimate 5-dehydrogenase